MAFSRFDKAGLTGRVPPYKVALEVYMKRKNYASYDYIDINKDVKDTAPDEGWRRLIKNPKWSSKPVAGTGRTLVNNFTIQLRNDDGIFGQDPETLRFFKYGVEYGLTSWENTFVRISLVQNEEGPGLPAITQPLGVFMFSGELSVNSTDVATATLSDVSNLLALATAADIKRGDTWLANWHMTGIVKELVGTVTGQQLQPSGEILDNVEFEGNKNRFSILGNVPLKNSDGTRDEARDFIGEYIHADSIALSQRVFEVGYSKQYNCPAMTVWDRDTDTWQYQLYQSLGNGYAFTFAADSAAHNPEFLYVSSVGNYADISQPCTLLKSSIIKINKTTLAIEDSWATYEGGLYLVSYLPTWPCIKDLGGGTTLFGFGPGMLDGEDNCDRVVVPFRCKVTGPLRDSRYEHSPFNYGSIHGPDESVGLHRTNRARMTPSRPGVASTKIEQRLEKGYYSSSGFYTHPHTDAPIYAYHNSSAHESFKYLHTQNSICYLTYFGGRFQLAKFSLETESHLINAIINDNDNGNDFMDNCVTAFLPWQSYLYVATLQATKVIDGSYTRQNTSGMRLSRFVLGPGSGALTSPANLTPQIANTDWDVDFFDLYLDTYGPIISTIRATSQSADGSPVFGTCLNTRAVAGKCFGFWALGEGLFRTAQLSNQNYPTSTLPFEISTQETGITPSRSKYYAQDQATGAVNEVFIGEYDNPTLSFNPVTEGNPIDQENAWSASNIFYDATNDDLIGISCSGPPACFNEGVYTEAFWDEISRYPNLSSNTPGGRQSQWRYNKKVSQVLAVADFKELKSHDAIEAIRNMFGRDWRTFATKGGEFNFLEAPRNSGVFTLRDRNFEHCRTDGTTFEAGADMITSSKYMSDLVNLAKFKTYSAERSPAQIDVIYNGRLGTADIASAVNAIQVSNKAQRIVLRCIQGGLPTNTYSRDLQNIVDDLNDFLGEGTIGSEYKTEPSPLLFSWSTTYSDLQGTLAAEADPSDNQVYIKGVYRESFDSDKFRIGDSTFSVGDTVRVSQGGVNTITAIVGYSWAALVQLDGQIGGDGTFKIGTTVSITPRLSQRISDSSEGIATLVGGFTMFYDELNPEQTYPMQLSTVEHVARGMILFVDAGMVRVVNIEDQERLPGYISVEPAVLGSGAGPYGTWAAGSVVKAALWVRQPGQTYAIGNTGVAFSIEPTENVNATTGLFEPGDRITITCAGLELKEIKHNVSRWDDNTSQIKHGKREWRPKVKPILMDTLRASLLPELNSDWALPRYLTNAIGLPLMTSLQICQPVLVSHPRLWPGVTELLHYIVGITYNLEFGSMDLVLLSSTSIERAEGDPGKPPTDGPLPGGGTIHDRRR